MSIFNPASYSLDPVSLAIQGLGMIGQHKQANAQSKANALAAQSAREARDSKISAMNLRIQQEAEDSANIRQEMMLENLRRQERAKVAAGEAGIASQSLSTVALLNDFARTDAKAQFNYMQRLENLGVQLLADREQAQAEYTGRLNALPNVTYQSALTPILSSLSYTPK